MKTIALKLSLLVFFFVSAFHAQGQNSRFHDYDEMSISDELSILDVRSFAQDSLGYMWIATTSGLNRYNGYDFEQFFYDPDNPESLPDNFVFCLVCDSSGNLWIGTGSGMCRYDFVTESFIKYPGIPANASIYNIYEDRHGDIWAATKRGPGKVDKENGTITFANLEHSVNTFWEDNSGGLWAGLDDKAGMAAQNKDGSWDCIGLPEERAVTCQYADHYGIWWLGTNDGIVFFNPKTHSATLSCNVPEFSNCPDNVHITEITEIEPFKIMIMTQSQGFWLYDMNTHEVYNNQPEKYNPLHSASLQKSYIDRQGNVWIGTYEKGFTVISKEKDNFNPVISLSDSLKNKFVTRISEDNNRNLWIGTLYNGIYKYSAEGGGR